MPHVPPPARYAHRVCPRWATTIRSPPFPQVRPSGARQRQGLKYEASVHQKLEQTFELSYFPGVWFKYEGPGDDIRYCQVDGLIVSSSRRCITLVECKYSHTPDAYWQMENLYVPVLRAWLRDAGEWSISTVEVVKWFDPATACPRKPVLRADLRDVKPNEFAIHILK